MTAEERQKYLERLCAMDEQEFQKLWENSEVRAKLQKLAALSNTAKLTKVTHCKDCRHFLASVELCKCWDSVTEADGFCHRAVAKVIDITGAELAPGDPENCQGNGEHPDFEICCDECDYYLACFPEAMPQKE